MRCIITGGGTGGHLFPGIAIAMEIIQKSPDSEVLFIGTDRAFEMDVLETAGFEHEKITVEGIKNRGLIRQLFSLMKIPKGFFEATQIIRRFKPDLIIGMGSYSAGPVVLGAWFFGVKIVLHEQNVLPGITNRVLARFADIVFLSFKHTASYFRREKIFISGNPVRKEIIKLNGKQERTIKAFTVLIMGGSQGAHAINIAVVEAVRFIKKKEKYFFMHQTGNMDEEAVISAYMENKINFDVKPFFRNMDRRYSEADLVICRAGATTIAEVTAVGRAAIFIPFPYAADNHQVLNADVIVKAGAADMILQENLSGAVLAQKIEEYATDADKLREMASRAKKLGVPDAAEIIADRCFRLLERTGDHSNII